MTGRGFSGGQPGGFGGQGGGGPQIRFGPKMTPVVKKFLIACGAVYFLQILFPGLVPYFKLIPTKLFDGWIWQLVTFNFLHGPLMHLAFNMLMLWMFGSELEMKLGPRRFILLMAVSGIGAGLCQSLAMGSVDLPGVPLAALPSIIGASGVVFGLLLVYGMTWPNRVVLVMFVFPMKVKWMVLIFGIIEFLSFVGNTQPGIAHLAHLGGMLFAYIFMRYDKIYMKARKTYYQRKLDHFRKKYRVYKGGKDDNDPPTIH